MVYLTLCSKWIVKCSFVIFFPFLSCVCKYKCSFTLSSFGFCFCLYCFVLFSPILYSNLKDIKKESNESEPCKLFETSCSRLKEKNSEVQVPGSLSTVAPDRDAVAWSNFYKCAKCTRFTTVYRGPIETSGKFCFDHSW